MSRHPARFIVLALWLLAGCSPNSFAPTPPPSATSTRYKFSIAANGLYRVTSAALKNAGVPTEQIDLATLQVFRGEREIALRLQGDPANFLFDFYGAASNSLYSAASVYWLRWGVEPGKRMSEIGTASTTGKPQESFEDTVRALRPTLYIPQAGAPGKNWFWQSLTAPTTTTVTVTLASALPAPAHLRVNFWGNTQDPITPNHHLRVFMNDVRVADETWDGQGVRAIDATIPITAVRAGENRVRLVMPGDTRAQADVVLLHSVEITYTRKLAAQNNALEFSGVAGTYRVEGFTEDAIDLFDITDPTQPVSVSNVTVGGRAIIFSSDAKQLRRWLAIGAHTRQSLARITPMSPSTLKSSARQADYLIITHPSFVDALQPLVKHRQQRGLNVDVVTTNEIYDEFGNGEESPLAIRALLDWAYHQWNKPAPRFVLLVGKASYDYRDYLNAPNKNLVPTFLVPTMHLGQAADDNWFVAFDDQLERPQLAVGRIPAKTPDQVKRVVNNIIAYESAQNADYRRRAVFVTDDKEPIFAEIANTLAEKTPAKIKIDKIYLAERNGDVDATRPEIIKRWNAGVGMITYIGHGSIDTWAAGPLFSSENLGQIKNGDRLPILLAPTCLNGYFYHPQKDSLAEELLFKNDGGIIAGLVPTGLSLPEVQSALMQALFAELFGKATPTLGEAIMRAKQTIAADTPETREVIATFGLLGDPALKITIP